MIRVVLVSLLLSACSAAQVPALRRPDGGWHLKCGASLERCVKHAEDLCHGRGYVVISGMSKRKLYGAELGVSQVEAREAELDIACADRRGDLPTVSYVVPVPSVAPVPSIVAVPSVVPASSVAPTPSVAP